MKRLVTWLVFLAWLLPAAAGADQQPAKGRLLVATELVRGDVFAETVILLLHYDAHGAIGIVVNRPTDVAPKERKFKLRLVVPAFGVTYTHVR